MEVHAHTHTESPPAGRAGKKFTHYLWEFLMLFLAVFCGFLAENQREHMVEHLREKQYMQSLLQDLRFDTSDFQQGINSHLSGNKMIDTLIMLLKSPERNFYTGTIYYLAKMIPLTDYGLNSTNKTYDQMKSSGNLRLIRDRGLLDSLGSYYFFFSESTKGTPMQMQFENRHDLLLTYNKVFDASVFQKMSSTMEAFVVKPTGNPPLASNDPVLINELCMRLHNIYFNRKVIMKHAKSQIKLATLLIKKIEKEYHLSEGSPLEK